MQYSYSDNYTYFDFRIFRCSGTDSNGNPCKSDAEIDAAIDSTNIVVIVVNSYFDFNDFVQPIKTFLDDQFYYNLISGFTKYVDLYIRQNTVERKDSIFRYEPVGISSSFYSIETAFEKIRRIKNDNCAFALTFYKDSRTINYDRSVFSFLDCCGLIGGVNEILAIAGQLIVGLFSGKIFAFTLLSAIYQVDMTTSKQRKDAENFEEKRDKMQDKFKSISIEAEDVKEIENKEESKDKYRFNQNDLNISSIIVPVKTEAYEHQVDESLDHRDNNCVKLAAESISNRYRYSFSVFDTIYNFLNIFSCFSLCSKRCFQRLFKRYRVFQKGEDKFTKDLDVVQFTRMQQQLKILRKLLMNKNERLLSIYHQSNAILMSSISEDNSSNSQEYNKIPKLDSHF